MMPSLDQVDRFLRERFGPVAHLVTLQGGGWSNAYGFAAGADEWVLRVGRHRDDFEKECVAATWEQPGLPVPEVLEMGDAFGCHYIVTRRHHGMKLADLEPSRVADAIPAIDRRHVLDLARRVFPGDDVDGLLPLYELHIALGELQYAAFRGDVTGMEGATDRLDRLLAGGVHR